MKAKRITGLLLALALIVLAIAPALVSAGPPDHARTQNEPRHRSPRGRRRPPRRAVRHPAMHAGQQKKRNGAARPLSPRGPARGV